VEAEFLLKDEEKSSEDLDNVSKEGKYRPIPEKLGLILPRELIPVN
jgi:hypothetical protein